jgi:hypothetical protein
MRPMQKVGQSHFLATSDLTIPRRKIKCDGVQPCEFCCRAEASCTFDTAYARGRPPPVVSANGGLEANDVASTSHNGVVVLPAQPIRVELPDYAVQSSIHQPTDLLSFTSPAISTSVSKSPRSTHAGLHGEYIGPASGVCRECRSVWVSLPRSRIRTASSLSATHP